MRIERGIAISFQTSSLISYDFDSMLKNKIKLKQRRLKNFKKDISANINKQSCAK